MKSRVKFEGLDYGWAAKYIAMTCTLEEIEKDELEDIVPGRRKKGGTQPGITSIEVFRDELTEKRKEENKRRIRSKLNKEKDRNKTIHWKKIEEAESEIASSSNESTVKK